MPSDRPILLAGHPTRNQSLLIFRLCLFVVTWLLILWILFRDRDFDFGHPRPSILKPSKLQNVRTSDNYEESAKVSSNSEGVKRVILWTPFFGIQNYILPLERYSCPVTNCIFTSDRTQCETADAILFHVRDTNIYDLPRKHSKFQKWILPNHESPPVTPEKVIEEFESKVNWTITYRLDSDIVLTNYYVQNNHNVSWQDELDEKFPGHE